MVDIRHLKERYKGWPLFLQEIDGVTFVFRQLSLGEFTSIEGDSITPETADWIVETALVHPLPVPPIVKKKIGVVMTLANAIIDASKWADIDYFMGKLDQTRKQIEREHPVAKAAICQSFNVTPEYVEGLPVDKYLKRVAEAEAASQTKLYRGKRDSMVERLNSRIPQNQANNGKWVATVDQLRSAGVEPAFNSLAERIQKETGKRPVTYEEAKGKRPSENLSKGELPKTVNWIKDVHDLTKLITEGDKDRY